MGRYFAVIAVATLGAVGFAPGQAAKEQAALQISMEAQAIVDLTNQARARFRLSPLKPNALLFKTAQSHSQNMARQMRLAHALEGKGPRERFAAAGYDAMEGGENIGSARPTPCRTSSTAGWRHPAIGATS
jgi:uncharacterized protein YkwD